MPRIESTTVVNQPAEIAFALSQTYGELRYRWDPFVREQHLLDGATAAGKGVRTHTTSRHHLEMVSEYISFKPPEHVGMRMLKGPPFFQTFSGGWNFAAQPDGTTKATWRYNFTCRPSWLRPIMDRLGTRLLQRDIDRRLASFAKACADPDLIAAVIATQTSSD